MDCEQATQVRGLLESFIQKHGRGRQEHDAFPQTT